MSKASRERAQEEKSTTQILREAGYRVGPDGCKCPFNPAKILDFEHIPGCPETEDK